MHSILLKKYFIFVICSIVTLSAVFGAVSQLHASGKPSVDQEGTKNTKKRKIREKRENESQSLKHQKTEAPKQTIDDLYAACEEDVSNIDFYGRYGYRFLAEDKYEVTCDKNVSSKFVLTEVQFRKRLYGIFNYSKEDADRIVECLKNKGFISILEIESWMERHHANDSEDDTSNTGLLYSNIPTISVTSAPDVANSAGPVRRNVLYLRNPQFLIPEASGQVRQKH
ncbi:hypothetical protein Bealeia1_01040 [Candidatus Bealeia paramacronuclearis]|uniref:Uncharacterized protein n=1 Tax=Candidatus Bealeia paramacronuclearis TaxID=1921001 RepID=A0ABZ2C3V9_9PROT|nr:hypothetical protein [Candidatus Bealeia paramacronuclearis]